MNQQIRSQQVRLIDEDGTQVGVKTLAEALKLAQDRAKDLVEIVPQSVPPVCKVADYSKMRFDHDKREREARKKQKASQLKEVRMRLRISDHDLMIKLNHAREFLLENNKVQITVVFMGREMQHRDLGLALIEKTKSILQDVSDVENNRSMMGNRMFLLLAPKKAK